MPIGIYARVVGSGADGRIVSGEYSRGDRVVNGSWEVVNNGGLCITLVSVGNSGS